MTSLIEQKICSIILSWLDTHTIGAACKEAVAKKLSQRIKTRLDQAGMITKDTGKEKIIERG